MGLVLWEKGIIQKRAFIFIWSENFTALSTTVTDINSTSLQKGKRTGKEARHLSQTVTVIFGSPCICLLTAWAFISVPAHSGSTLICCSTIHPSCLSKDKSKSTMLCMGFIWCLLKWPKAKAFWITKHVSIALFALGQGTLLPGKIDSRNV